MDRQSLVINRSSSEYELSFLLTLLQEHLVEQAHLIIHKNTYHFITSLSSVQPQLSRPSALLQPSPSKSHLRRPALQAKLNDAFGLRKYNVNEAQFLSFSSQSRKAQKTLHTTLPIGSKGHFLFSLALGHDWLSVSSSVLSGIQLIGLISGVGHLRANPAALKTVVKALANHRPFHPQSPSTCPSLPTTQLFIFRLYNKPRYSPCHIVPYPSPTVLTPNSLYFLFKSEVKSKSLIRARDFLNNPSIDLFPLSSITRVSSEVASLTLLPTIISLFIASYPHTLTPTPVQFLLSRPNIHLLNSYLLSGTFINCFFASIPPRLSYCILNYKSITHPFVLNPSSRHSN
ncbi:hypothetical protein PGTUg99_005684 [Puccinia graminis f. sp. tritici]|uniref:Uncharacterized protein n=1 Tax=Puccinia graminis f. sp. tritici TaxID=56615 RepID=A0A5B0NWQ5_PUCGR|nr:hypothetical protein PGTUg99_005684 [Puccinia graminis f. sp. tritici]